MAGIIGLAIGALACITLLLPNVRALGHPGEDAVAMALSAGARPRRATALCGYVRIVDDDWEQVPSTGSGAGASGAQGNLPTEAGADAGGHPERGPNGAPVTITEYGDFQCPYCRRAESTLREVRQHYGSRVRIVYVDFPLSFHRNAMGAALAARCAGEQGKFWKYHDAMFASQDALSEPDLKVLASSLGLDSAQFNGCLDQRKYESAIRADQQEGERIGVHGTPYFLVNGDALDGAQPFSAFEAAIDKALAQSGGAPSH